MNDDDENFDENLGGEDASFDDFDEQQNTLGDLWRNNPLVKVGIIFAAGAAIFGTIILFGGEKEIPTVSYVSGGSAITAIPGTDDASPKYVNAIEEFNESEVEEAYATGGSALPVPIDPPRGRINLPEEEEEEEDPLQRWRRLQEERLQREIGQRETIDPAEAAVDNTAQTEAIQALSDLMSQQMQSILETQGETKLATVQITSPDFLAQLAIEQEAEAEEASINDDDGEFEEDDIEEIIIPAGTIEYGQLLIEANTDAPGPVLAMIASGPLSGSRLLGSFEETKELLTLNFDTIVIDGVSHSIDAIALDPGTTLPALATDVDHHYFARVVLPTAAAFIEGAAAAIANSGLTSVTVEGGSAVETTADADTGEEIASGIQEAGQELSQIIDEAVDEIEVTVVIESGTPIGILFVEAVTEGDGDS